MEPCGCKLLYGQPREIIGRISGQSNYWETPVTGIKHCPRHSESHTVEKDCQIRDLRAQLNTIEGAGEQVVDLCNFIQHLAEGTHFDANDVNDLWARAKAALQSWREAKG